MLKLFSFLKNKKTFFIFLLTFFCICTLFIAQTAWAEVDASANNACVSNFGPFSRVIAFIIDIPVLLVRTLVQIVAAICDYIINTVLKWPITNPAAATDQVGKGVATAFSAGWVQVKNLGNMLIALGFVIVGIATALRIREYEAKKYLSKLITVALLINFSGLFCGLIIDASNLVMSGLLPERSVTAGMAGSTYDDVETIRANVLCLGQDSKKPSLGKFAVTDLMFIPLFLFMGISFLFLALVMAARFVVLGILFIFSPLAFVFFAFPFPKAKDVWTKWSNSFVKWAFMGVGICFFLNIAGKMLKLMEGQISGNTSVGSVAGFLFIVLAVIAVGVFMSIKSSGVIGAAALAAGGFIGGAALGAVSAVGKVAGSRLSSTAAGRKAQEAGNWTNKQYGRLVENLGLRQSGATAAAHNKRVEDAAKPLSAAYAAAKASGDKGAMERIQTIARSQRGVQGAAAMKAITDAGDVSATFQKKVMDPTTGKQKVGADGKGVTEFDSASAFARSHQAEVIGASGLKKAAMEQDYRVAGADPEKLAKMKAANPKLDDKQVASRVRQEQLVENMPKMSAGQLGRIDHADITHEVVSEMKPNMIRKIGLSGNKELIAHVGRQADGIANDMIAASSRGDRSEETALRKLHSEITRLPGYVPSAASAGKMQTPAPAPGTPKPRVVRQPPRTPR